MGDHPDPGIIVSEKKLLRFNDVRQTYLLNERIPDDLWLRVGEPQQIAGSVLRSSPGADLARVVNRPRRDCRKGGCIRNAQSRLTRVTSRIWSLFAAAVLIAGTAVAPAVATADPGDDTSLVNSPTLNLRTLGANADIALYGIQGSQTLTIPVPRGLIPAELAATVQLPVNTRGGTLEVTQDQRVLSRVPLPPDQAPITIPLTGTEWWKTP
ncbi:hypothetical protein ACNQR9_11270 [Mycolicibacterium peregrinum]